MVLGELAWLFLLCFLPLPGPVHVPVPLVASGSCSCSCGCPCSWTFASAPVLLGASALAPFLGLLVCDCCLLVMSLLGGSGFVDLQGLCCTPLCLLNCVFRKSDVPANFDVWVAVCFGCPWWMPTVLGTAWFSSSDFVPIL